MYDLYKLPESVSFEHKINKVSQYIFAQMTFFQRKTTAADIKLRIFKSSNTFHSRCVYYIENNTEKRIHLFQTLHLINQLHPYLLIIFIILNVKVTIVFVCARKCQRENTNILFHEIHCLFHRCFFFSCFIIIHC